MAIVSEDMPQTEGPNASMPFGEATNVERMQKAVQSAGPSQQTMQQMQGPPPQGPTAPGPQGPPSTGPVQPGPTQDQPPPPGGQQGRLDMKQVFPPMPELKQQAPWREQLRTWAAHPDAGPALRKLADLIKDQHGPLY